MTISEPSWQDLRASLRAFVARRVRNPADVDDLVQRVLLQIVRKLDTLRDADRLHAWVYRAARNVVVDHYRSVGSRRERTAGDAADLDAADASTARHLPEDADSAALRELAACMAPMLARLSPAAQEAIRLVDIEGATQLEAARHAGVSLSGMKSRVQRGRRELRAVFEHCCRIERDRRGDIAAFEPRHPGFCGRDGGPHPARMAPVPASTSRPTSVSDAGCAPRRKSRPDRQAEPADGVIADGTGPGPGRGPAETSSRTCAPAGPRAPMLP